MSTLEQRNNISLFKFCLAAGSIMHIAGLIAYARFPYVYLLSILVLSVSYYLYLREKQYKPFSTVSFWGMVLVLSIPIVGLIAGFQKMMVTQTQGRKPGKRVRIMTTLVTLLLAIPIAVFFAAIIMPAFPGTSEVVMNVILIVGGGAELALLIAVIAMKNRTN